MLPLWIFLALVRAAGLWQRRTCKNTARIRRDRLEERLLGNLPEQIMREEVVDYVMDKFQAGLLKEMERLPGRMDRTQRKERAVERELANLANAVAAGQHAPTIMAAIAAAREREISDITEQVVSSSEDSIKSRIVTGTSRCNQRSFYEHIINIGPTP
jgi:hypothetical protein